MGPDGCLSSDGDNAGLIELNSIISTTFDSIWQKYCNQISRADFWALLAKLSIEFADPTKTAFIPFQYGRVDSKNCSAGVNRLPDAQLGLHESDSVFVKRLGLTLNDTVALIGAHTVGHVHPANSGFGLTTRLNDSLTNAWDTTPSVFDNQYFKSMIGIPWKSKSATKTIWLRGPVPNILLNADITLGFNASLKSADLGRETCGPAASLSGGYGCSTVGGDFKQQSYAAVVTFSKSNKAFLNAFSAAFPKLVTVGYGLPANVDGTTASGKLGTLTAIDLTSCPAPSAFPTLAPSAISTKTPFAKPTSNPTSSLPSAAPSIRPTSEPTSSPSTRQPTLKPTATPSNGPTTIPTTLMPSTKPITGPTYAPTSGPTTSKPSATPIATPSATPTAAPTTVQPSAKPSTTPSAVPTARPTTVMPSIKPSPTPSNGPTLVPSTTKPSSTPTTGPTTAPSSGRTASPTTLMPTVKLSAIPSTGPTTGPSVVNPTKAPTAGPTTVVPSFKPTAATTVLPTTKAPSIPIPSTTPSTGTQNPTKKSKP